LTGSLPSGHPAARLWNEKKDRIKSKDSFFIEQLYLEYGLFRAIYPNNPKKEI
jgi:tRNA nucleotidyltransferase/poly(A) polymerase